MQVAPTHANPNQSPEVVRLGSSYHAFFGPDPEVAYEFRRVRDQGSHLFVEVHVHWRDKEVEFTVIDLLDAGQRRGLADRLEERAGATRDWRLMLDQAATEVIDLHRARVDVQVLDGEVPLALPNRILEPVIRDKVPTLLYGQGGSFKSTLVMAMLVSVASGCEVVPGWAPRRAPALLLDWESDAATVDGRRRAISRGAGIEPPPIQYVPMVGRLADSVDEITDLIEEHEIGLVGVDSVGMALGKSAGGDANESTLELFAALRQLSCAAILIDHITGEGMSSTEAVVKPYGSVYKYSLARAAFELRAQAEPEGGRTQLLLRQQKSEEARPKLRPIELAILHEHDLIGFEKAEVTDPALVGSSSVTIADRVEGLLAREGAMSATDIAEGLGLKFDSVKTKLNQQRNKRFVQLPGGRWGLHQRG